MNLTELGSASVTLLLLVWLISSLRRLRAAHVESDTVIAETKAELEAARRDLAETPPRIFPPISPAPIPTDRD